MPELNCGSRLTSIIHAIHSRHSDSECCQACACRARGFSYGGCSMLMIFATSIHRPSCPLSDCAPAPSRLVGLGAGHLTAWTEALSLRHLESVVLQQAALRVSTSNGCRRQCTYATSTPSVSTRHMVDRLMSGACSSNRVGHTTQQFDPCRV